MSDAPRLAPEQLTSGSAPAASAATSTPPTVSINNFTPPNNAAVVGSSPGVQVAVQGQITVAGCVQGSVERSTLSVTVQIGSQDFAHPAKLTLVSGDTNGNGTWNWSYIGQTPVGGNLTIVADATLGYRHDPEFEDGGKDGGGPHKKVWQYDTVDDTQYHVIIAAVAPVVTSPTDGQVIPGQATGTTVKAVGQVVPVQPVSVQVQWSVDGATTGPATGTTTTDAQGNWSAQIPVPLGPHTLSFKSTVSGVASPAIVVNVQVALTTDIFDVSPRSYLQALVEFGTQPFTTSGSPRVLTNPTTSAGLTPAIIDSEFFQSVADLLDDKNSLKTNEAVRQVRISVEVLREYLGANPPSTGQQQTLMNAEAAYRQAAYLSLLTQAGTSYDEIRLARTYDRANPNDWAKLQAIADRLGINLGRSANDELDQLYFDLTKKDGDLGALTEADLERLFGLVDTTRDPLSQGTVTGDAKEQVKRWMLRGVEYGITGLDGMLGVTIAKPQVSIKLKSLTLASGQMDANGNVVLFPAPNSKVSGWMSINYQADSSTIALRVVPRMLRWQQQRLRDEWAQADFRITKGPVLGDTLQQIVRWDLPALALSRGTDGNGFVYVALQKIAGPNFNVNVYADKARTTLVASGSTSSPTGTVNLNFANTTNSYGTIAINYQADTNQIALAIQTSLPPIIDPDLLIDRDFKLPTLANPYSIYSSRKTQVANWFNQLKTLREGDTNPDPKHALNAILSSILKDGQYYPTGMQITDIVALDAQRQQGVDISPQLTALYLPADAFNYLLRICPFVTPATPLLDSEWSDIYSILVQVQKRRTFFAWSAEEQQDRLTLGPDFFNDPPALPDAFPTGVDLNRNPLPDGSVDPHWTIIATPSGATNAPASAYVTQAGFPVSGPWLRNTSTSRWISPRADESNGDAPGSYTYRTSIDLSGYNPASVRLIAKVAVDNDLAGIFLNNQLLGLKASGYTAFKTLEINGPFQAGLNNLDFVVINEGTVVNPSGLRVEISFAVLPVLAPLPSWRATLADRQAWESRLQARIDQERTLVAASKTDADAAEEETLPILKRALCAACAIAAATVTTDWLSTRLLIDVQADGLQKTTRLSQAIEMMQELFFALRNHEFEQLSPQPDLASWGLSEDLTTFDREWVWTSSYAKWQAIMLVFLFPENLLLPTLRLDAATGEPQAKWEVSPSFNTFVQSLGNHSLLTSDIALQEAINYLVDLNAKYKTGIYAHLPMELTVPPGNTYQDPRTVNAADLAARTGAAFDGYVQKPDWIAVGFLWEAWYFVPLHIALELQKAGQFEAALDWFHILYAYDLPLGPSGGQGSDSKRRIFPGLALESTQSQYLQVPTWIVDASNPHQIALTRACPYTRFAILSIVECLSDFADAQFGLETGESLSNARLLCLNALELLSQIPDTLPADFITESNPRVLTMRLHAENKLMKLRSGRNIAGMLRVVQDPSADGPVSIQPTAYRYSALVDRARQLVSTAQQIEGSYLAALQKGDEEAYTALRASQDLDSANATIKVERLKVQQAIDSVTLAQDQTARAQIQVNHYNDLLSSDILSLEQAAIDMQYAEIGLEVGASALYLAAGIQSGFSFAGLLTSGGNATQSEAQVLTSLASAAGTGASVLNANASLEEKHKDWQFQLDLSNQDVLIGQQQVVIANDNQAIASQDLLNANLQARRAQATVDFLATKFTNADLYRWMSGVLGGVYAYFLRQATAVARLAEYQLAFERQETQLSLIRPDYWQPPSSAASASSTGGKSPDRAGLTGAERLLEDLTQLDQYALETDKRKLQMTRMISLAQLDPFAFQLFIKTGVMRFATPMDLFDHDFPGQFLRLIKRIRVTVIALVPPTQGIRATLANPGISRVIVEDPVVGFETTTVQRDPQLIALTSPANSTGLFDLTDTQSGLLLPFENLGVDTSWEFVMPQASNPLDFSTIADVLLTMDYTALDSPDYRQQVLQGMNQLMSADRAFSFRQDFADAWYDLNNSSQSATAMKVQFQTERGDFPPNIQDSSLTIAQLLLYFVAAKGATFPVGANLTLSGTDTAGNSVTVNGTASSTSGQVLSTRRGNASGWMPFIGLRAAGSWTLDLSKPDMSSLFQNGQVQDILFVITYSGRLSAWPS